MPEHRSLLGLDEDRGFFARLGQFPSVLLLGPLLGMLLFAGIQPLGQPWRAIAEHCSEALAVLWAFLLVFIWWRPPWLRRAYLAAEREAVRVVRLCCVLIVGFVVVVVLLEQVGMR